MKKIVLSIVFVFVVAIQMNANLDMKNKYVKNNNVDQIEIPSCLTEAYNNTNRLEAASEGGAYSWDIETWSRYYSFLFDKCDRGYDIDELTNIMIRI